MGSGRAREGPLKRPLAFDSGRISASCQGYSLVRPTFSILYPLLPEVALGQLRATDINTTSACAAMNLHTHGRRTDTTKLPCLEFPHTSTP